jgi:hypothetical protein
MLKDLSPKYAGVTFGQFNLRKRQMKQSISPSDVYDKDLNFLVGSGASYGLFPTLELKIKGDDGLSLSLEDLATKFEKSADARLTPLFMHYYRSCIYPAQFFTLDDLEANATAQKVGQNYRQFVETILNILQRRKSRERRCNLFTTNYDGCFPLITDKILTEGNTDFLLNDGTRGFRSRYLHTQNFNTFLCQTGIFERHQTNIPQINLIHLHGSVYWKKSNSNILVNYENSNSPSFLSEDSISKLSTFSDCLNDDSMTLDKLKNPDLLKSDITNFWSEYEKLPIVNPTKWKFHETVFEEHYYQMLRLLSYELEKPNAVLITFGFSFADEHILNLVKRSLSNPHLQVFVCCYSKTTQSRLENEFRSYKNVQCLALDDKPLDFTAFNELVFCLEEPSPNPSMGTVSTVVKSATHPNSDLVSNEQESQ